MMLGYIDLSMKLLHYIFSLCISFANLIGKPNDTIRALALVSFQSFDGFLHFLYRKIPLVISIDGGDMASSSGVTVSSFEMSLYSSVQLACSSNSYILRLIIYKMMMTKWLVRQNELIKLTNMDYYCVGKNSRKQIQIT